MATEKIWEFIPSYTLGNASTQTSLTIRNMWFIKAALTGEIAGKNQASGAVAIGAMLGKWAMYYSCNGVTAGAAGDGVDHLRSGGAGVCTEADFVYGLAAAPHSWYVLRNVTAGYYLLISYEGSSNRHVRIVISPNAFTGGTTTDRPTAVNEASGAAGVSDSSELFSVLTAATGPSKCHLALCENGNFVWMQSKDGTNFISQAMLFAKTTDTYAGGTPDNVYNGFLCYHGGNSGAGVWQQTQFNNYLNWWGRSHTGSNPNQTNGAAAPYVNAGGLYTLDNIDQQTNKYGDWPVYIHTFNPTAKRGRLQDIKLGSIALSDGDTDPLIGQVEYVLVGMVWVPMCEALSL